MDFDFVPHKQAIGPEMTPRWTSQNQVTLIPFRPSISFSAPISLFFVVDQVATKIYPSGRAPRSSMYAHTVELQLRIDLALYLYLLVRSIYL